MGLLWAGGNNISNFSASTLTPPLFTEAHPQGLMRGQTPNIPTPFCLYAYNPTYCQHLLPFKS